MKTTLSLSFLTVAMLFGSTGSADLDLRPGFNGAVNDPGMYVSDGSEALTQDPCLSGDVISGNHVAKKLLDPSGFGIF